MKVLMLSWEYPPRIVGGISRVVYELAQSLGRQGHEIHVVTCWEPDTKEIEKDKNVIVHRVRTYDIQANNFIDWVMHLNFAMAEYSISLLNNIGKIDVIHAHDWLVAYAARVLKHSYKIPLVCTIHATEHGRNQGIYNELQSYINNIEWWLAYESWKIICNSHYMKNEIQNIFNVPANKINVICNGVNSENFTGIERDDMFRRNFANDHEKMVFFVGRLVQEKGVHILIDAIPKIIENYHDVKFVIGGKGPELDHLRAKAHFMGIGHRMYFTGYVSDEDLHKLYKCADIAVFPSLYEPFGIVALEAMAADVPVVVTDTGGLGEIVEHAQDGMKAYAGNANSVADCIIALLHHQELYEKVKENARNKIKNYYNWDLISRQTLAVYTEVVREYMKSDWRNDNLDKVLKSL
ncbi:glycosyltransferase family 4 protein [Petroclostridium sp. X23]|uniref:glycosyltransferase family 4 protein n=1 Tax=Petroclostridium sp. X23 TaxID=3045146 RepID=UPI0024ACB18E|nr:glycosyltransferase family 4 protein [Petroclostridium sp. X23]WHH58875.1 glycosyltransferase family 4 protein [Petroclostridium sp. X23]